MRARAGYSSSDTSRFSGKISRSRGASGGRYVAGKQAERRSAPVQPDVQRPEADDEEIPLLRDYANREAAQHRAETEENDIPLLQQYLKRPPLSQVMPQERHQAPAPGGSQGRGPDA